jgi:membrane protease subunit HflK
MPWNNSSPGGGPGPWGTSGGSSGGGRPNGPQGPWGGGRGPNNPIPDLDELIGRIQAFIRSLLPPGLGGPPGRGLGGGRGMLLVVLVLLAAWLGTGFYRVQPDEQGVVLRFGAYNRTTLPGLNYHMPWPIESVLLPPVTRINRVEVGFRSGRGDVGENGQVTAGREEPEESLMLTGDENIIDINFAVFWRIRDAEAYLFNTRNPAGTVKAAAESVMREVIGRTPIEPALTGARTQIEVAVMKGVQAILDQYGTGVDLTQVQLLKSGPPDEVIESFRDVQRASTDAETLRNQAESYRNDIVPRARGDAARITASADADKQASVAQATGQGQRFLSVLKAYDAAKDVTMQRLYIETMQDILSHTPAIIVDDKLQGIVPYLPLNEIGRLPAAAPPNPAAPKGTTP